MRATGSLVSSYCEGLILLSRFHILYILEHETI